MQHTRQLINSLLYIPVGFFLISFTFLWGKSLDEKIKPWSLCKGVLQIVPGINVGDKGLTGAL